MQNSVRSGACVVALLVAAAAAPHAQGRGGGAWSTAGGDAQRTGWVRTDPRITKDSAAKGLQLLWKRPLDKPPGAVTLTQPVLLPNIISYKGFKALAYLGGAADTVYSIDYDLNRMFWQTRLSSAAKGTPAACAGGSIAVTRSATLSAAGAGGRGAGRGAAGGPPAPPAPGGAAAPGAAPGAPAAGAPPGGTGRGRPRTRRGRWWWRWRTRWRRREQRLRGLEHGHGPRPQPPDRRGSQSAGEVHGRRGQAERRGVHRQRGLCRCGRALRQCRQRGLRDRSHGQREHRVELGREGRARGGRARSGVRR